MVELVWLQPFWGGNSDSLLSWTQEHIATELVSPSQQNCSSNTTDSCRAPQWWKKPHTLNIRFFPISRHLTHISKDLSQFNDSLVNQEKTICIYLMTGLFSWYYFKRISFLYCINSKQWLSETFIFNPIQGDWGISSWQAQRSNRRYLNRVKLQIPL